MVKKRQVCKLCNLSKFLCQFLYNFLTDTFRKLYHKIVFIYLYNDRKYLDSSQIDIDIHI